jgi:hypothetical protein
MVPYFGKNDGRHARNTSMVTPWAVPVCCTIVIHTCLKLTDFQFFMRSSEVLCLLSEIETCSKILQQNSRIEPYAEMWKTFRYSGFFEVGVILLDLAEGAQISV